MRLWCSGASAELLIPKDWPKGVVLRVKLKEGMALCFESGVGKLVSTSNELVHKLISNSIKRSAKFELLFSWSAQTVFYVNRCELAHKLINKANFI